MARRKRRCSSAAFPIKLLPDGAFSRLTTGRDEQARPRWEADGRYVTYIAADSASGGLQSDPVRRRADGIGEVELVASLDRPILEGIITSDGWRIVRVGNAVLNNEVDIVAMAPSEDTVSVRLASGFREAALAPSPDGRWLAHTSDETRRWEVYLRSFPDPTITRAQVSPTGGQAPVWSRDARELFFVNADRELVSREGN